MRHDLVGLNGGQKHHWLRTHHKEVIAYIEGNGMEAAMSQFNCKKRTLERLQKAPEYLLPRDRAGQALVKAESAIEIATEAARQLKVLEHQYDRFTSEVAFKFGRLVFKPLIDTAIILPEGMEKKPDPLDLADLWGSGQK